MPLYKITIQDHAQEREPWDIHAEHRSIGEAMEESIWHLSDRFWILAVDFCDPWGGEFALTDTRGITNDVYANKADAIAHGDIGDEVLVAIPHLSR